MTILRRAHKTTVVLTTILVVSSISALPRVAGHGLTTRPTMCSAGARLAGRGEASEKRVMETLDKLALRFEEVREQGHVWFTARAQGMTVGILPTEAVMVLSGPKKSAEQVSKLATKNGNANLLRHAAIPAGIGPGREATVKMKLIGANRHARINGEDQLAARTNYFIGSDASRWRAGVSNFDRVTVEQAYPGVDVVYYGSSNQLEYDFKVAPGANCKAITLRFTGAGVPTVDESGDLVIETSAGAIRQHKPIAYQFIGGERREITARYGFRRNRDIGVEVGNYNHSEPLIIDPVLSYSTYFGGSGDDFIYAVVVDARGNAYVAGITQSSDLPIIPGAFQSNAPPLPRGPVGFVAKVDLTNNKLLYSTYLGGTGQRGNITANYCYALAIDAAGSAYVTGQTISTDFPTTANAFQRTLAGGGDAFVTKLSPTGSELAYSTYLGSGKTPVSFFSPEDEGVGIAIDAAGSAYVTGRTTGMDFPVTSGVLKAVHDHDFAFVGNSDPGVVAYGDAFVTKLNPTGTGLVYSTYLGGDGEDSGKGIKVDAAGNAYVVGNTRALNFPTLNSPQASLAGSSDAFVAKLNENGSALFYSTYVGGDSEDSGAAIAIDALGNAYVAGATVSTDLPVTAGAFQTASADVTIYKSTNGGTTWASSNSGFPGSDLGGPIIVDPANPSSLSAATFGGVFNSADGGQRWRSTLGASPGTPPSNTVTFDPGKPANVYGVSQGFLLPQVVKSVDGGKTWRTVGAPFPTNQQPNVVYTLAVDPVSSMTIYASTEQALYKSNSGGGSWVASGKGLPNNGGFTVILAIDPRNGERLFARASNALFTSANGGKKWHASSLSDPTILAVTFDPTTASTVYASGAGLFKSSDSGETWQEVDNDLPTFGVGKVVVDPTNALILYATTRGGVFKSTDGGHHWRAINLGLSPAFLGPDVASISLAIDPSNPSVLYARGEASALEAFVGKLNQSGSAFVYLSYLGGSGRDSATGIAVDGQGSAYVTGQSSSVDFPVANAFQPDKTFPAADAFITRQSSDGGGLAYSTYLGGSAQDYSNSIDVDAFGNAYVVGYTVSTDFPLHNSLQSFASGNDGFIARITNPLFSQPAPTVTQVSPSRGSSLGGAEITVLGANFQPGASVRIGGMRVGGAEVTGNSIRTIVLGRINGGTIETVDVAVTNPDGQSFVLKNGFTYLPAAQIGSVSITAKQLTVFGSGFDKGSVILLRGQPQPTRLEIASDITTIKLVSKKAAKRIASGETAVIQVRNEYGLTSPPFNFTK